MKRSMVRGASVVVVSMLVLAFACYLAYAFSTGISGQTKKNSPTAGCGAKTTGGGSCHGTSANTNTQVLLSGPSVLPVGVPGTFTISVSGATTTGGGCDIAASGGTLSSSTTLLQSLNQELTHVGPIATPFSVDFTYASNSPGTATLYANGKTSSGWNWAPNFSIRIGPPPAPAQVLPTDGSAGVPTSIKLVWSGVHGPKWKLQVSPTQSFSPVLLSKDGLTDTTYLIPEGTLGNNTQYYWRVSGSDTGGNSPWSTAWSFTTSVTGMDNAGGQVPGTYALDQNWPNPFNPTTGVRFSVPLQAGRDLASTGGRDGRVAGVSHVKLVVYDVLGREVARLVDEVKAPGTYDVRFDGSGLASGIYVYRLTAGSFVETRTMVLLK